MKHIFHIFAFCFLLAYHTGAFSLDYQDEVTYKDDPAQPNTLSNITRARLLCNHVNNFDRNINNLMGKYELKDDVTLSKTLRLVGKMDAVCEILKTQRIDKHDAEQLMTSIVKDLSTLNKGVKIHLKQEISSIEQYHLKYSKGAYRIAAQIDLLTGKLESHLQKNGLSDRDRKILKHVKRLKRKSTKLKTFGGLDLHKKSEIKSSLIRIVKEIKTEIKNIRKL